jgi:hypothetical protein
MVPRIVTATDLEPGDQWVSEMETVVIDGVLRFAPNPPIWPQGSVRVYGRIVRGYRAGRRTLSWTFQPDQPLDIEWAGGKRD